MWAQVLGQTEHDASVRQMAKFSFVCNLPLKFNKNVCVELQMKKNKYNNQSFHVRFQLPFH